MPLRQLLGTAGQTEPLTAALRDLPESELAVNVTVKKTRMNLGDFRWSPRGRSPDCPRRCPEETRRRAGRGPATVPVQLKPATLEVQAEPWSLAAVETRRRAGRGPATAPVQLKPATLDGQKLLGLVTCRSQQLCVPAAKEGTYRQLRGVGPQSHTRKTQPLIQQRCSGEVGRSPSENHAFSQVVSLDRL